MNKKLTILSFFFLISISFISFLIIKENINLKEKNLYLISQLKEKEFESNTSSGGLESSVSPIKTFDLDYIFPIAEEDFKYYTSPFGVRISPFLNIEMKHSGVDIASTWRAQVVAIADGIIIDHYPVPGTRTSSGGKFKGHPIYGGMIKIRHDDDIVSLYAHLSYSNVHTGDKVRAGEIIGRVGGTGLSQGEHLHFEMLYNNEHVNPLLYISDPRKE